MLNQLRNDTAADADSRVHSYIVDHDLGFAPNPFHGVCTLATCKPQIRRVAAVGDYIIGTGSRPHHAEGRLVYWMRVDEVLTFDQYWLDPRFRRKRPAMRGSRMLRYGDNIYHHDAQSGELLQEDSFHSERNGIISRGNLQRDAGTTHRVLVGRDFAYWGGDGPCIPEDLADFVHKTQGHKNRFPPERARAFVHWLRGLRDRGLLSDPTDW